LAADTEAFFRSFADLAGLLISEHDTAATLARVSDLAVLGLPACDSASVSLVERDIVTTASFAGELARAGDDAQIREGEGPCLSAIAGRTMILCDAVAEESRWPRFCAAASELGVGAVLSAPLVVDHSVGALNLYSTKPHSFEERHRTLASLLAGQAAVALANALVHEREVTLSSQLREALVSRAVIDQAKGIIMERERCSPEEAFEILRKMSQHTNRKLRDIAQQAVDSIRSPAAR
jgi:GAF domain-containing protein